MSICILYCHLNKRTAKHIGFEEKLDVINQLQKLNALQMYLTFFSPRAQCAHFVIALIEDRQCSYNVTL